MKTRLNGLSQKDGNLSIEEKSMMRELIRCQEICVG